MGRISAEGIAIPDARKTAIEQLKFPSSAKDLQRFLGVTAFLARFITHLSKVAAPLHELVHAEEFKPSQVHRQAFETLKRLVVNSPVLMHFVRVYGCLVRLL